MGRKKTSDAGDGSAAAPKKGKGNLIPAVVVAVGLLGGGYFMSSGGGAKAAATPAAAGAAGAAGVTTTTAPEIPKGEIVKLDSITLNLADGRFVKLGLALQLSEKAKVGEGGAAAYTSKAARALDLAISTFGAHSYADLAAPGGREATKEALSKKIVTAYGGDVEGIYFTEFVMQ